MKISYHWLKEYIDTDLGVEEVAHELTMLGLEIGKIETSGAIPGNLEGIVVGHVLSAEQHPNADRLRICQVDTGAEEALSIVCGAPNVAAGQKVAVATVGTVLYPFGKGEEESFKIKKGKIRGEVSLGMICAEDEMGIGPEHDGIMVLDASATPGSPVREYIELKEDIVLEVDLTPNRVDGASHFGTARDLAAALNTKATLPALSFDPTSLTGDNPIPVTIEDQDRCKRYSSLYIQGVTVSESPEWLQDRLTSIGLRPINNVVDVTNFVLHELGQPLHAFDAAHLAGKQIIVKTLDTDTTFVTLDDQERSLKAGLDLMICDAEKPLCIAGTMGGLNSGVTEKTADVFLESAYFDAGSVRRTSKRLGINSDSSFRFERGADPNMTVTALLRAADLIVQLAGGSISKVSDQKLDEFSPFEVSLSISKTQRIIGADISKERMLEILSSLEIDVANDSGDLLDLRVPQYRVDVKRDVDVMEDILRVYGYNNVELPAQMHMSLNYSKQRNEFRLKETVANYFAGHGYYEILNNSLVPASLGDENAVSLANPLSEDLGVLRQSMLPGVLETVRYNQNRQQSGMRLFEFGKTYRKRSETTYAETSWMTITVAGDKHPLHWESGAVHSSLFTLTREMEHLRTWAGVEGQVRESKDEEFAYGLELVVDGQILLSFGRVSSEWEKRYGLKIEAYHLKMNWDSFLKAHASKTVRYAPVPMYPSVRRDISLLMNKSVTFAQIKEVVEKANPKLIKSVDLHDVYLGNGMEENQKSYLVSVELRDDRKTLADSAVEKIMGFVISSLEKKLSVALRK